MAIIFSDTKYDDDNDDVIKELDVYLYLYFVRI